MAIIGRFLQKHDSSFFLFGPRGTGKTTWLKETYPEALYIDLLSPDIYRRLLAKPERLKQIIEGNPGKTIIIIDEIQRVPQLLTVVHQKIDENKKYQFILTGSSSRKLKRTGIDLLAGRAVNLNMHPFLASELKNQFNFENSLQYGMLPLIFDVDNKAITLESYITLYIKEEVQQEGFLRNIGNFTRFLESISFSHGNVLNISDVARDCEVSRKTVEGYFSILEDLLLSFILPVFSKRAKRKLIRHKKFYIFDSGVFRSLRPKGPLDNPAEIDGACLEGLVAQQLRAWISYSAEKYTLFFWRTKSGNEVDFILYGDDSITAIEVKNSDKIHKKDLTGLKAFTVDYPQSRCFLLYRGNEQLKIDNIYCIPCEDFLISLVPGKKIMNGFGG